MTAVYKPNVGMLVTMHGKCEGFTMILPLGMTVAAIQKHLKEVQEWIG